MRLYSPLIRYWCMRWGVAQVDLDDVTQEVWLALGPTLGTYQPGPGRSFRGWLRGVAYRKAQEWYRRRSYQLAEAEGGAKRVGVCSIFEPISTTTPRTPARSRKKVLHLRALSQVQNEFEERTWKAFLGMAIEGKSASEVGAAPGSTRAPFAWRSVVSSTVSAAKLGELLD